METVTRDKVLSMMRESPNLTIVEVLPQEEFERFHIPGAVNVPLNGSFDEQIQEVAASKIEPVIVYCRDAECDASPKAAKRMDGLGYGKVYDYEAGKMDWKEAGLPTAPLSGGKP